MSRKILMALMGLEIGGAETHVVELSRELKRQGNDIVVISNGGVYEEELLREGIRCYHAPLHRRNFGCMLRSLFRLFSVIRREKPEIVHAHARIPAFLCGILHPFLRFPFVTTAHWVFHVDGLLRRLTNWGERTIAVSDDIRDYLGESYGVVPENVIVTINGIDTEKFSPSVSGDSVREEFSIPQQAPVLTYVSRMDESRALAARQLIEIAPQLCVQIPDLRLLIVGGGNVYQELCLRAAEQNRIIGYDALLMTGARTDINRLIAAGDIFVGVSRAALEAMAAEKTVIVAGNEGYIGLFTPEKLSLAQENNFCCRGCAQSSGELLLRDILHALRECDLERRQELGRYGREVIFTHYSVRRMAADALRAYEWVCNRRRRVVVSGYYGFRNLGDDAILLSLYRQLNELAPGIQMVALSARPRETSARYGVRAVQRFNPFSVWWQLCRADYFISGGGSLLQDHTSTRSLLYYTALIRLAALLHRPVLFYANGIGPVRTRENRERVRKVTELAELVTLRDEASLQELRAMGVQNPALYVTADPVYRIQGITREEAMERLRAQGIPTDRPLIGVSVRFVGGMEIHREDFAAFCDRISEWGTVVFLVMQQPQDREACETIRRQMKTVSYCIESSYDPRGMMGIIGCMELLVSTRLHSIIFAAREGVPVLGIEYDPKVSACLASLQMPSLGTFDSFDGEGATLLLREMLAQREQYREKLAFAVAELTERAEENEKILAQFLDRV